MKIEIEPPEMQGYIATGEYRKPVKGDYVLDHDHKGIFSSDSNEEFDDLYVLIYKPVPKEPTLLERIEEKWPDKQVELLSHNDSNGLLSITGSSDCDPHTMLPSVKGFQGYVYNQDNLKVFREPVDDYCGDILMPIAVLFNK